MEKGIGLSKNKKGKALDLQAIGIGDDLYDIRGI